jgi:hypothetical protein
VVDTVISVLEKSTGPDLMSHAASNSFHALSDTITPDAGAFDASASFACSPFSRTSVFLSASWRPVETVAVATNRAATRAVRIRMSVLRVRFGSRPVRASHLP